MKDNTIIKELESQAGENFKVYLMSDGSEQMVFSPSASGASSKARGVQNTAQNVLTLYGCENGNITEDGAYLVGVKNGQERELYRTYIKMTLPEIPKNPRIKKVELCIPTCSFVSNANESGKRIGLYLLTSEIAVGQDLPSQAASVTDFDRLPTEQNKNYLFDITRHIRDGQTELGFVLKLIDESQTTEEYAELCSGLSQTPPQICVNYESNYALNTNYRTYTHDLGFFGQGAVDLTARNLMFETEDFALGGNRMPVTLKHMYTSSLRDKKFTYNASIGLKTADFSAMNLGNGWRLNLMQSICPQMTDDEIDSYIYMDENGAETKLVKSDESKTLENGGEYYLYKNEGDGDFCYDPELKTLTQGDLIYLFDEAGRLIQMRAENGDTISITYQDGRLVKITDAVNREITLSYNSDGTLAQITSPDSKSISYSYNASLLTEITNQLGEKAQLTYQGATVKRVTLKDKNGNDAYAFEYGFSANNVTSVQQIGFENSAEIEGAKTVFTNIGRPYIIKVTTTYPATDDTETAESESVYYSFDDEGNVIGEYMSHDTLGNVAVEGGSVSSFVSDGRNISNITNLLLDHSFENEYSMEDYGCKGENVETENHALFGKKVYRADTVPCGTVFNKTMGRLTLPKGEYTFSAYARVVSDYVCEDVYDGACLMVGFIDENSAPEYYWESFAESDILKKDTGDYVRLSVPFTLENTKQVELTCSSSGKGVAYFDGAQLESNGFAGEYNMLQNGNFERGADQNGAVCWNKNAGVSTALNSTDKFSGTNSLQINTNLDTDSAIFQSVAVKSAADTRESFTLSGWAKGYSVSRKEREEQPDLKFRLRAEITYDDNTTEDFTADFATGTRDWQFASVSFAKSQYKKVSDLKIYCEYGYNNSFALFDNISLTRDNIEPDLTPSDFVTETEDENQNETQPIDEIEEISAPEFEELMDEFGNALTETTFSDGSFGTIYRSFEYSQNGNDLVREIDARGNATVYEVNAVNNTNESVTDRCGNVTEYEYDAKGRTTKVTSKNAQNELLATVDYDYDVFDELISITRGDGQKYNLKYNPFHNLESIGVDGMPQSLVTYSYKNKSGRLKEVAYANGDKMKATYNSEGHLVAERWYNSEDVLIAYYKYAYDDKGNIVRSIDSEKNKEYNYIYKDSQLVRATESSILFNSGDNTLRKTPVNIVDFVYDKEGKLVRKHITDELGEQRIIYYQPADDNGSVLKLEINGKTITSHSKTDEFGRKLFDEVQFGSGVVSRQFDYYAGEVTQAHTDGEKVKSAPTTQLVKEITFADGRTLEYEYDAEERITKVIDSLEGTTEYTYDALGQLLTETKNGTAVNSMTYDNYGNISTKNDIVYGYNDTWKDLLTSYNGQSITYDAQGNPTSYLGHTLTWEKGRQIKSFDNIQYTYNANGIRTSKTVDGVEHIYTLDGAKILKETWGANTLIPIYDDEESACGIIYNGEPYYFNRNLQNDVIAICNSNGETVARYSYDAWGVCSVIQDTSECGIATINPYRYRGYYYDNDIEMYYLQSRYYDPTVARFLNVDDATYNQSTEKTNEHTLFAYCQNDSINKTDESGFASVRVIGYGLQIEIDGHITFGIELVWYINSSIRKGRAWYVPYVYLYGGAGLSSDLRQMVSKITKNPALLFNPKKMTKASASISIFAIFGYVGKFTKPEKYTGWFVGVSATIWNVKAYFAYSDTCFVVGAGISTSKFSASTGATYYIMSSDIFKGMSKIYNSVSKKGKTLKKK